jgi:putative membrane protein
MFAVNAWAFTAHPEVWALVASVVASYTYAIRRIGPLVVPAGQPAVRRRELAWFVAGTATLWVASDWPLHDIAEKYLYSAHMLQHMMLSYFMPPMMLMAIPEWLARLVIGTGRGRDIVRWCCKPVVAGVSFNAIVMITHIPALVNRSAENGAMHYVLHLILVVTALALWMCVCGPIPEWRIGPAPKMLYLFSSSLVPTVPAGWLTFAEGLVYKHYNSPVRVFGLSPTYDQQLAGVIMKIGGSVFLWTLCIGLFFRKIATGFEAEQSYRRRIPDAEVTRPIAEYDLTFAAVTEAFERTEPAPEPERPVV